MADVITAFETTTTGVELSTLPANSSSSSDVKTVSLQHFIWIYILPVVLLIGIIGNILSIIVLMRKAFRETTTGVYLPFTAIADIAFLTTGALEIFEISGIFDAREYSLWTCRLYKVVHYTSGDVSIWLLVAFNFDRFIAVCFPLSKRRVCRWKRAATAAFTITFLSFGKNLHEFWTRGPEYTPSGELRRICGSQAAYHIFLDYVRPWLVLALVMAIPFILILVFNCLIVRGLLRAQRVRALSIPSIAASKSASPSFRQTTFMCLGISLAFLICVAPSIVLLIGKPYWKHRTNATYKNAKAISNFLVFVNHSINFFLYCVTGERFRHELRAMLTCQRVGQSPLPPGVQTPRLSQGQLLRSVMERRNRSAEGGALHVPYHLSAKYDRTFSLPATQSRGLYGHE